MRSTGAPAAVYETRLHDTSMVLAAVVMRVDVQVGVCAVTVMLPEVPNAHPLTWIVPPPVFAPSDHELAAVGTDDESVKPQLVTFCAVAVVVLQPLLLVQLVNVRVESAIEAAPSVTSAVPVVAHDTDKPLTENVAVPVPVILQAAPLTHVTDAEAGDTVAPSAATSTTAATRLVRTISFIAVDCLSPAASTAESVREIGRAARPDRVVRDCGSLERASPQAKARITAFPRTRAAFVAIDLLNWGAIGAAPCRLGGRMLRLRTRRGSEVLGKLANRSGIVNRYAKFAAYALESRGLLQSGPVDTENVSVYGARQESI